MSDRYILNKEEDMVFDVRAKTEVMPHVLCVKLNFMQAKIEELQAENKILKEALEFYADEDSWCHSYGTNNNNVFDVYGYPNEKKHGCLKARQALEKIK